MASVWRWRPALSGITPWSAWTYAVLLTLDIAAMIINILAYTGAQSQDDRPIIKNTFITFPPVGDHIQRLEIALPSLGLITHTTLAIMVPLKIGRLSRNGARLSATRCWFALVPLPYHLLCLGAWIASVVLQAEYVPVLGAGKLPECVKFGDELSQCGMVTASWILSMVMCLPEFLFVLLYIQALRGLFYISTPNTSSTPAPAPQQTARPQPETSDPVRYHVVLPPGADASQHDTMVPRATDLEIGTATPSYTSCTDAPPPYSKEKPT
jgi:hypothetical protein